MSYVITHYQEHRSVSAHELMNAQITCSSLSINLTGTRSKVEASPIRFAQERLFEYISKQNIGLYSSKNLDFRPLLDTIYSLIHLPNNKQQKETAFIRRIEKGKKQNEEEKPELKPTRLSCSGFPNFESIFKTIIYKYNSKYTYLS